MKTPFVCLAALALNTSCRPQGASTERSASATAIPRGWIAIPPYDTGSVAARCANQSSAHWHVDIAGDGTTLLIRPESTWADRPEILSVPGGRLIGIDRGEFGGGVWWVPDSRPDSTLLTPENLHDFIQLPSGRIIGLVGLAHLGIDTGAVVAFEREATGWRAVHLLDLGAAPRTHVRAGGDTLLVLTTDALQLLPSFREASILHRNETWPYLYATSMARDSVGTIYIGMRYAVARLSPANGRFQEEWLVPAACRTLVPVNEFACRCDASQ